MRRQRLFVAIDLDEGARRALERTASQLRAAGLRGRFVPPENYHVTVAFLGYVNPSVVPGLTQALRSAAHERARFDLALQRIGAFPSERRARVAWVGPRRPNRAFSDLCASVWAAIAPLGFARDREAEPHVTLCRCEPTMALPHVVFDARTVHAPALTLFESQLSRVGPRYLALEVLPLCAVGAGDEASAR